MIEQSLTSASLREVLEIFALAAGALAALWIVAILLLAFIVLTILFIKARS